MTRGLPHVAFFIVSKANAKSIFSLSILPTSPKEDIPKHLSSYVPSSIIEVCKGSGTIHESTKPPVSRGVTRF